MTGWIRQKIWRERKVIGDVAGSEVDRSTSFYRRGIETKEIEIKKIEIKNPFNKMTNVPYLNKKYSQISKRAKI